jgi:hypothetical protein
MIGLFSLSVVLFADEDKEKTGRQALIYAIVPGGGQVYNQSYVRGLAYLGVGAYYSLKLIETQSDYDANPSKTTHRLRNNKVWLLSLTYIMSMIDAYVEAELTDFENYDIDGTSLPDSLDFTK